MGYIYFCLPLSGALMIFYSFVFGLEKVKQLISGKAHVAADPQ